MNSPAQQTAAEVRVLGVPLCPDPVPDGAGGYRAELDLDPDWPIFAEHFPGRPMLPGSFSAQLMATVATALADGAASDGTASDGTASDGADAAGRQSLREVRFSVPLVPPARIRVTAAPDRDRPGTVRCQILLLGAAEETVAVRGEVVRHD